MDHLNDLFNRELKLPTQVFKKGHIIQKQGDVSIHGYLVQKGLLKSYTIDSKGKEHIFMFAPENWIISDIESQEFGQPAALFIECIEDSEVVILNRENLISNNLSNEQYQKMMQLLYRRIAVLQRRIILMMSTSAAQRYANFLENYPDLTHRVPQWMIASYLGITPEALSKIRGQIARSK